MGGQARVANAEAERAMRLSKEQADLARRAEELEAEAERHWQRAKQLGNTAGVFSSLVSALAFELCRCADTCDRRLPFFKQLIFLQFPSRLSKFICNSGKLLLSCVSPLMEALPVCMHIHGYLLASV